MVSFNSSSVACTQWDMRNHIAFIIMHMFLKHKNFTVPYIYIYIYDLCMRHNLWSKKSPLIISCLFSVSLLITCKVLEGSWALETDFESQLCQREYGRDFFSLSLSPKLSCTQLHLGRLDAVECFQVSLWTIACLRKCDFSSLLL